MQAPQRGGAVLIVALLMLVIMPYSPVVAEEDGACCISQDFDLFLTCLLYTSPSPRDGLLSRMPSSA